MKREYFECECFSDEHTLTFTLDPDDGELYTSVFLKQWHPWYARLWIAIKYLFGYKCKYGHWGTWILREEDSQRLADLLAKRRSILISIALNDAAEKDRQDKIIAELTKRIRLPKDWKRPEYVTDGLEHDMYVGPCRCGRQHEEWQWSTDLQQRMKEQK